MRCVCWMTAASQQLYSAAVHGRRDIARAGTTHARARTRAHTDGQEETLPAAPGATLTLAEADDDSLVLALARAAQGGEAQAAVDDGVPPQEAGEDHGSARAGDVNVGARFGGWRGEGKGGG
jgi:hypothetical protein